MLMLVKLLISVVLLAVAAFCGFGFLATFEPPGSVALRIAYIAVGLASLGGSAWILLASSRGAK